MFGAIGFVVGLILLFLGVIFIVFFPATQEYQSDTFSITGIMLGILFVIVGGALVLI